MTTGGNMVALGGHSTASMAVKAVVAELKNRLSTRFNFLENLPSFFYDFEKGLSPQFLQYYAKIPERHKSQPWIALAYSYDSVERSNVQPRRGFIYRRPVTNLLKRDIDVVYVNLPVVFSILTNDSKTLNAISTFLLTKIDWSFSCQYQDLLWPIWVPCQTIPLGWYIRPSKPNGCLYMCSQSGTTSSHEPLWQTEIQASQEDNTVQWQCIEPDFLTVKAGSFVKNETTIQNPIDNGIMYQYDFGLTLSFTDLEDAGSLVGVITEVELNLLNWYKEGYFKETIRVPE